MDEKGKGFVCEDYMMYIKGLLTGQQNLYKHTTSSHTPQHAHTHILPIIKLAQGTHTHTHTHTHTQSVKMILKIELIHSEHVIQL